MTRIDIRGRLPSRDSLPDMLSEQTLNKYWVYTTIALAILGAIFGLAFLLGGVVLVAMMAVESSVLGVMGAALMVGTGVVMLGVTYIWLTTPA